MEFRHLSFNFQDQAILQFHLLKENIKGEVQWNITKTKKKKITTICCELFRMLKLTRSL